MAIPTGPSDEFETAGLLFTDLIHAARERVWIATPYFVPDHAMVAALQMAQAAARMPTRFVLSAIQPTGMAMKQ